jgi:hypothetical protein
MIRVVLPAHLRTLARVDSEVKLDVAEPATQRAVLDALEACYPMLRGTIRDHVPGSAADVAVLRLRGGPVLRVAGRSAARRGRVGGAAAFRCRGRCRVVGWLVLQRRLS